MIKLAILGQLRVVPGMLHERGTQVCRHQTYMYKAHNNDHRLHAAVLGLLYRRRWRYKSVGDALADPGRFLSKAK